MGAHVVKHVHAAVLVLRIAPMTATVASGRLASLIGAPQDMGREAGAFAFGELER